jgi:general stress protein YciG
MAGTQHSGNPGNFAEDREKAARAGHVGGQHSSGNFANDRERAAEAGRKGGQASHGAGGSSQGSTGSDSRQATSGSGGQKSGNFADDREKASEAGRKGGRSSHWICWKVDEMNDQADGIATVREIRATFASPGQMQDAVSRLSMSGFDRADLSLPSPGLIEGTETP